MWLDALTLRVRAGSHNRPTRTRLPALAPAHVGTRFSRPTQPVTATRGYGSRQTNFLALMTVIRLTITLQTYAIFRPSGTVENSIKPRVNQPHSHQSAHRFSSAPTQKASRSKKCDSTKFSLCLSPTLLLVHSLSSATRAGVSSPARMHEMLAAPSPRMTSYWGMEKLLNRSEASDRRRSY
ncbi:hypothetical protein BD410DRAFT_178722 [Rickenella mellea]|uniref:Uncharacterized protein n=1 Tax=Rickenella mellea TaxID=50990 RepID=A0A4Y7Q700_9AGAM|nr:hypothetical protein BD410DRAFT_178722 [Rickenella mellea]